MDVCRGAPKTDQGYSRPCPLRDECWRYLNNAEAKRPRGAGLMQGPYDFDDEECGVFLKVT